MYEVYLIILFLFAVSVLLLFLSTVIYYWWELFEPKWYKPHYGIRNGKLDYPDIKKLMEKEPANFNSSEFSCKRKKGGFYLGMFYLMVILFAFALAFTILYNFPLILK